MLKIGEASMNSIWLKCVVLAIPLLVATDAFAARLAVGAAGAGQYPIYAVSPRAAPSTYSTPRSGYFVSRSIRRRATTDTLTCAATGMCHGFNRRRTSW